MAYHYHGNLTGNYDYMSPPQEMFAPLHPVTPARVDIYPPRPAVSNTRYAQSASSGSNVPVGTMAVMSIFTLGLLIAVIYYGYHILNSGNPKQSVQAVPSVPAVSSVPAVNSVQ